MTNIPHLIEAALLLLVAYLIGCLIGYFLRASVFQKAKAPAAAPAAAMARPAPAAATVVSTTPATATSAPPASKKPAANKPATNKMLAAKATSKPATKKALSAPKKLDAPRNDQKDNLKVIKGIGPKIEGQLNALGVYHFDQIAEWNRATIGWVDDHLSFKGRIDREKWVQQAKTLAKSAK